MASIDRSRRLFAEARVAVLTTISPGGPHAVPCCFVVDGDTIYSAVDAKPKSTQRLRRLRNVEADPRASILAHHWSEDWSELWWVRADGRARIVAEGPEHDRAIGLLSAKYPQYDEERPRGPVLGVRVEVWRVWSAT